MIQCNIGNPQALGQEPLQYMRDVLSLVVNPKLMELEGVFKDDIRNRAQKYLDSMPSVSSITLNVIYHKDNLLQRLGPTVHHKGFPLFDRKLQSLFLIEMDSQY